MDDVAVIGGGAAGLVAAVSAARQGACVTLYEATARVGAKILATGNGRCNLTNTAIGARDGAGGLLGADAYNCPSFVAPTLECFGAARVRTMFAQLGLMTVEEREGRVYPLSNTASSVVDVLRAACERYGVRTVCEFPVDAIAHDGSCFCIAEPGGGRGLAKRVVVATGGGSKLLRNCGHRSAPAQPVLCPLTTETDALRGLSGVRVQARVSAYDDQHFNTEPVAVEEGEVLFRDYGLSGIVIFNMSRVVQPGWTLSLDFLPAFDAPQVEELMRTRLQAFGASIECAAQTPAAAARPTERPGGEEDGAGRAAAFAQRFAAKAQEDAGFGASEAAGCGGGAGTQHGAGLEGPRDARVEGAADVVEDLGANGNCQRERSAGSERFDGGANVGAGRQVVTIGDLMRGVFHPRVNTAVLRAAGIKAGDAASASCAAAIARACKDFRVKVTGFGDPKQAQVTRGGALVDEFDSTTLESRKQPGLYAAGEVLNVDARCGGFNLHWAWASGLAAGRSAARG